MSRRRAVTLLEVLVAATIMVVVAMLIGGLLGGNERLRHHSHEHVVASSAVRSVAEHYADYPFAALEAYLDGHATGDEAGVEEFLIAMPQELAEQTRTTLNPRARMAFQRMVPFNDLGLLRVGFGWRSRDGRPGQSSVPRLVIDRKLYAPIELPRTAAELRDLAAEDRARQLAVDQEDAVDQATQRLSSRSAGPGDRGGRHAHGHDHGDGHGHHHHHGPAAHGGHGGRGGRGAPPPDPLAETEFGANQESGLLRFNDFVDVRLSWDDGTPIANAECTLQLADGQQVQQTLDEDGHARIDDAPPGPYVVGRVAMDSGGSGGTVEEEEMLQA